MAPGGRPGTGDSMYRIKHGFVGYCSDRVAEQFKEDKYS